MRDKKIPAIPTYVDSPMATSVTALYEKYSEDHTMSKVELGESDHNPLSFDSLHFTQTPEQSKALNKLTGPAIIISAAGMATGGRIMHHLRNRLSDTSTVVLFTGFQAQGTLGRQLIDGATHATVLGVQIEVKAQIKKLLSMSGHSDQGEIISWLKRMPSAPKHVFLTHGEDPSRTVLKGVIEKELGWTVHLPKLNEMQDLTQLA
jgi:metallo-beta-lactamase family protein